MEAALTQSGHWRPRPARSVRLPRRPTEGPWPRWPFRDRAVRHDVAL